MQSLLTSLTSFLSPDFGFGSVLRFGLLLAVGALILGLVFRFIQGKCSDLNHALSAAMGILFVYVASVVVYTFNPAGLSRFLSPLPFVVFDSDQLHLFALTGKPLSAVSSQLLSMVILAFLVTLLDSIIPRGEKIFSWLTLRILTVILAMAAHYAVTWAFSTFLPGTLAAYAPMILLGILIVFLLLGVLRFLLGLVLTIANPILGAIYAFFFSSKVGKQLSKAVLTTTILTILIVVLEQMGYSTIPIAESQLLSYLPLLLILIILWFLIGRVL